MLNKLMAKLPNAKLRAKLVAKVLHEIKVLIFFSYK